MTKYLVGNVSVMPYDVFCICSSESDAQEMILALTEEELYEAWYQYDQDCADFFLWRRFLEECYQLSRALCPCWDSYL